ncbi:DJ-1/PfpI family protein [Saccharothrix sp. 6-C]|uniref:DJ-1/PfpI family protein n=1 Tax=Saccharothrix sp. 6-C TaxID=2781735 RepID=UPI0019177F6B|nr:DJ-1/PfpI family protein [Saccharothrix sp. 6-C]QQQ80243.1 DJ-1/PfpI family protein [Saccharothrix sp. 6-C]
MRAVSRIAGAALVVLLAALALPAALGAPTLRAAFGDLNAPRADGAAPPPARVAHDPAKPTAVVVVGDRGAVVSDTLAPYEVLATTGAFNVYAVAPSARPAPLTGGLDLVPDLTFAGLADLLGGAAPDVVVVPAMPDVGESTSKPVTDWLAGQAAGGALLLGVCNGSGVLASAGLLDGRDATAHRLRLDSFEDDYPAVGWVRGTRYVDDGDVITTAGILSGVDGTLRVVERLVGPEAAAQAAEVTGWRHYRRGEAASMPRAGVRPADAVVAFNSAFGWDRDRVGVLLTDGVGEIELASAFDAYGQSLAVRTVAVAPGVEPVRSRHGLTFAPRADPVAAGGLDRLVVPGAGAARRRAADRYAEADPVYLHREGGFPFDGVLRDLARTTDVATATWTARVLEYPTDHLSLSGSAWPWTRTLRPFGLAFLGVLAALGLIRAARGRRSVRSTPAAAPPPPRPRTRAAAAPRPPG